MNKSVIFDLDGTLIDSVPDILENLNITLKHFGYTEISYNRILEVIGYGAKNLVKGALNGSVLDQKLDEILAYYNNLYTNSNSTKTVVYEGIFEVLKTLKGRGYKLAVCTNKPQITTDRIIEKFFNGIFDCVYGYKKDRALKPDKLAVLPVIEMLNADINQSYFVGDMETDAKLSINSGLQNVSVLWGYGSIKKLEALNVKIFVKTPSQLLSVIK